LQPVDWEERAYIEDLDDFKPEVSKSSNLSLTIIEQKVGGYCYCMDMIQSQEKFLTQMLKRLVLKRPTFCVDKHMM